MSDETVVLTEESVDATTLVRSTAEADLEGFDYSEYLPYFPDECREHLVDVLSNHKYGWKSKARTVKKIASWTQYTQELRDQLVEICTGMRTRVTTAQIKREALAAFISGLHESGLRALALQYAVSYDSFMNRNDRTGLTEAILDEMNV